MGREKEYRQRLTYQVQSVLAKTAQRQIAGELEAHFGASAVEAELIADRCVGYLERQGGVRLPNQIVMELSRGRQCFHRCRRPYAKKAVVLTAVDAEDLDLELEFGLKAFQNNRLVRLIEEAEEQDALLRQKELVSLCQITPTSIRERLRPLRRQGIRLPLLGLKRQERVPDGLSRSACLLARYLGGQDTRKIREELFVSRPRYQRILREALLVLRAGSGEAPEAVAEAFGIPVLRAEDYQKVFRAVQSRRLRWFERQYSEEVPVRGVRREGMTVADRLRRQLSKEFGYSPAKVRALLDYLDELKSSWAVQREDGEILFWAVAATEPAGKPLSHCRLVPVRLNLLCPEEDLPPYRRGESYDRISQMKFSKILRYATSAKYQGGYLTQADLSYLLGIHTVAIGRLLALEDKLVVPLRGVARDIGRGVSHRRKILELYMNFYTETEIVSRTGHSYESIESYLKEFAAVLVLRDRGMPAPLIRKVLGRSLRLVQTYLELLEKYEGAEYALRMDQLRQLFHRHEAEFDVKKN
jgi:hypothetical protein